MFRSVSLIRGMKAVVLAIAAIVLFGCATSSSGGGQQRDVAPAAADTGLLAGKDEIRPDCEKEWPDDWAAIAFCVERRTEGFEEMERFVEKHDVRAGDTTPQAEILANCSRKWQSSHGHPDWSAIAFCVERQWDGYQKLHP